MCVESWRMNIQLNLWGPIVMEALEVCPFSKLKPLYVMRNVKGICSINTKREVFSKASATSTAWFIEFHIKYFWQHKNTVSTYFI